MEILMENDVKERERSKEATRGEKFQKATEPEYFFGAHSMGMNNVLASLVVLARKKRISVLENFFPLRAILSLVPKLIKLLLNVKLSGWG